MSTPVPVPGPSPIGEICIPVAGCLPLSGGISEGGYIVLLLLIAIIIVGLAAFFIAFRFGAAILKASQEAREEAKAAKYEVKNSHTKNLRDDLDDKDEASHVKLDTIVTELQSIRRDMTSRFDGVNDRISGVDARVTGLDVRLNRRGPSTGTIERMNGE